MPEGSTSRGARRTTSGGLVTGFTLLLFAAAVAAAAPAAAIDDPARPDARVTHGPSCQPGGLVVEVTAGTVPYFVRLATTRQPAGEDEATVAPGTTVVLRSDDVDWGETIDGRLEYSARDDSGKTFVDELDTYSFTRPTKEDCDAVRATDAPASPSPSATVVPPSSAGQTRTTPAPSTADGSPTPSAGAAGQSSTTPSAAARTATDPRHVSPGGTVTLLARGFLPGEPVAVLLHGTDTLLASATAAPDGSVAVEVRIPERTAAGPTRVDMIGQQSETSTDVELQVAALGTPVQSSGLADLVPLAAAATALVTTVAGLVSVAGRQRSGRRSPIRSA